VLREIFWHELVELRSGSAAALNLIETRNAGNEERAIPEIQSSLAFWCGGNNGAEECISIYCNHWRTDIFAYESNRYFMFLYNFSDSRYGIICSQLGSVVVGNTAAIATNATDGFLYVPTCAGTPTGVPTAYTGKAAIVVDSTTHKLYFYDGAWRDAGP
jgi:hypothetical protein